ncbi:Protein of unknown function [Nitrosospira sp. Nl5]|uniref:Pvc16 family protein n=1 Tax=Nitrosospira sp. Nl5 TaxID=200120 RepID=UPI0008843ABB|nr:Pvc16 family protein [Nitrosospira sp. Nl5]SCY10748.1 Protein of unknown function [Nitrosospira sp. Nl5]
MAVTNLSDVTSSLETLLKENIERRLGNMVTVNTSSVSPLDVSPMGHMVNVFLFHFHPEGKQSIHENSAIDPPVPASFSKPVTLYYHLTAHHNASNEPHLIEQDLLGHALATLLDYPQLNDERFIGGTQVFETNLTDEGNEFELEVVVKSDNEALTVWAGYEGGAIRPSLYFKVKNVKLQPEMPTSLASPILTIGKLVVPNMGPKLFSMQSTVTASFPSVDGPIDRQFKKSPAELYLGAAPTDLDFTLKGASIDQFVGVDLSVPVGNTTETLRVDFTDNAPHGWAIRTERTGVVITFASSVERLVSGVPTLLALEPGPAQLGVTKTEYLEREGAQVPVEIPSNRIAFTLNPHIASITPTVPRRFRIDLDGDYDLNAMAPPGAHSAFIRLAVGGTVIEVVDNLGALTDGQCAISGARSLDFILPTATDDTTLAYVQLWVRDSVSQPFWIGSV